MQYHGCTLARVNLLTNTLLLGHDGAPPWRQEFQWLEYFAGKAACTTAMRSAGYVSARFDKLYWCPKTYKRRRSNYYDLNSPSGFALLV